MLKASLQEMMLAFLKLLKSIFTSGIMPNTWCRGLITPIYKSGGRRNEPSNYRGICLKLLGKVLLYSKTAIQYSTQFSDWFSTHAKID